MPSERLQILSPAEDVLAVPPFVPLAITPEVNEIADAPAIPEASTVPGGIGSVEIGSAIVLRVPGDVAVERAAALIRPCAGW